MEILTKVKKNRKDAEKVPTTHRQLNDRSFNRRINTPPHSLSLAQLAIGYYASWAKIKDL